MSSTSLPKVNVRLPTFTHSYMHTQPLDPVPVIEQVGALESKIAVLEGHVGSLRMEIEREAARDVGVAAKMGAMGGGAEGGGGRMRDLERQVELLRKERDERSAGEQDALERAKRAEDKVSSLEDEGKRAGGRCAAAVEEARKAKAEVDDMKREVGVPPNTWHSTPNSKWVEDLKREVGVLAC